MGGRFCRAALEVAPRLDGQPGRTNLKFVIFEMSRDLTTTTVAKRAMIQAQEQNRITRRLDNCLKQFEQFVLNFGPKKRLVWA